MQSERISSLCVEGLGMGGSDREQGDHLARVLRAFADDVLKPMLDRVGASPGEVKQIVSEIRNKLDALETLANAFSGGSPRPSRLGTADDYAALGPVQDDEGGDDLDDIGRNQRSRLRELVLLEAMSQGNRPYALQQLMTALTAKGFSDSNGAVVSQLHRLKKTGVVDQPGNGMYAITDSGLGHLRRLRSSFGGLL